ncbi:MAG: hypothetical protein L0229_05550 [Blastocatellia bacterium]|nr:hypothetical protein [Blastocatellia bacterium]
MLNTTDRYHRAARPVRLLALALACASLLAGPFAKKSPAQDPFTVAPQAYKLRFENDRVRVVRVHYAPREKLPVHNHPDKATIFVYLNDSGPVRFRHKEGFSGSFPATRPPTKARAYRLAGIQPENHEVENLSDLPSDFLQIILKTEMVEASKFRGRFFPEDREPDSNYRKVEFENGQVRITRIVCAARAKCDPLELSTYPALTVALSPVDLKAEGKSGASPLKLSLGETRWFEPGQWKAYRNAGKAEAEFMIIEFISKPAAQVVDSKK